MRHVLCLFFAFAISASAAGAQGAQPNPHPTRAPFAAYRMPSRAAEIALARTAAPPSISMHATVLVLGARGYETAIRGTNGFVCFVERSWTAGFDQDEVFWDPTIRAPNCFNPPAARTELRQVLKRTEWVLAGANKQQIIARTRIAFANHTFTAPAAGSFSFMLSKKGDLGDQAGGGPWHPHVMLFVPHGQAATWAAGLDGSPILGADGSDIESTVLYIPVPKWSDGTRDLPHKDRKMQM